MPLHELMQTTHFADEFVAGTQVEMICVAQNERSIDIREVLGRESFDRRLCTDRCKDRREKVPMGSRENARAGAAVAGCGIELEHTDDYTILTICPNLPVSRPVNFGVIWVLRQDLIPGR